ASRASCSSRSRVRPRRGSRPPAPMPRTWARAWGRRATRTSSARTRSAATCWRASSTGRASRSASARPRWCSRSPPGPSPAVALGARPRRIVLRHLLPLAAPTLLVQATFGMAGAIVAEGSLSFLGVGAPPPQPSWGAMIDEGRPFLLVAPHLVLFPGLALALAVLALQLLGDGLRDVLDVRAEASARS